MKGARLRITMHWLVLVAFTCSVVVLEPALAPAGTREGWMGGCTAAGDGRGAGSATAPPRPRGATLVPEQTGAPQADRTDPVRLRLVLNIPAYRLDVFEGGTLTHNYSVAVGTVQYQTPRGLYAITQVEWNPWWIPPPGDWASAERITPPGSENPMGRVKLQFRPYYFLHGTPFWQTLGSAASHGCVRMSETDATTLARLVQRYGAADVSVATIDELRRQLDANAPVRSPQARATRHPVQGGGAAE